MKGKRYITVALACMLFACADAQQLKIGTYTFKGGNGE